MQEGPPVLQAGQKQEKHMASGGPEHREHGPPLRLTLVSLGALQLTGCRPETFLGTFHRQHVWKVELILPTAPSPHLGGHL